MFGIYGSFIYLLYRLVWPKNPVGMAGPNSLPRPPFDFGFFVIGQYGRSEPWGGANLARREDRTVSSPANPSHFSLKCSVPLFPCVKVNGVVAAPGVASGVPLCFSPTKPDPLPLIRASVPRESRSSRRSYALLVDFPIDPLLIPPTTPP